MSKTKTKDELEKHRDAAISRVEEYLNIFIASNNPKIQNKADKFSYWLEDYITFLNFEKEFAPSKMRRYKRGEILKVHLGYNIGSEEGGLHYCAVLDKENSIYSPVMCVVPLTSVKPWTDLSKLHNTEVYLGNELFTNLSSKISLYNKQISDDLQKLQASLESLIEIANNNGNIIQQISELTKKIEEVKRCQILLGDMKNEVQKMKKGSIALINQITTISKIRIYNPKTNDDVLSNIKLSNDKLDLIDDKIGKYYTNLLKDSENGLTK
jgi:mRNA-degrading endonuclease toxin of MazEF toxin-antitoxin module